MYKLLATIQKDVRVMARDRVGLLFMFGLPILLVVIVTSIQNSTFELMNKNTVPLLLCNRDTGVVSHQFIQAVEQVGLFNILAASGTDSSIRTRVQQKDAMLALVIPANFSVRVEARARMVAGKAMTSFGLEDSTSKRAAYDTGAMPIALYYHPILQASFRRSAEGALYSALQVVESKHILESLYFSLNEKTLPDSLESALLNNQTTIEEYPVSRDRTRTIPNASQHNVPAWTVFAMFFVVISLASGIVREKVNGSFVRLKTLPTSYLVAILSKQVTYVTVTMFQAAVIFAIGVWLFPVIGLPTLYFPKDWAALIVVTFLCGWCAVSYAICIGVFARTEQQATGFGAISIVILAAIGGLMVPSFAMPGSFRLASSISPLHWGLEAYYGLFLEGGGFRAIWANILPLVLIIAGLQGLSYWGLKRKNLI
jgi:ABC-2 type transport system permease protein